MSNTKKMTAEAAERIRNAEIKKGITAVKPKTTFGERAKTAAENNLKKK